MFKKGEEFWRCIEGNRYGVPKLRYGKSDLSPFATDMCDLKPWIATLGPVQVPVGAVIVG